jgi:prepilin-type N-terminal cleavage/methylation domain-containing protein
MKKSERGFSLVELMVSVGISAIIAYVLYLSLRVGDVQNQTLQWRMTLEDQAREGLYRMIQEIRQTAPNRVVINANRLQIDVPDPASPVTGAFRVNWAGAHRVVYSIGGAGNRQLLRTDQNTGRVAVLANDVTGVTFVGNGAQPTLMTVTIRVQRALPNNRLLPAVPLALTGQAEIRNG